MQFLDLGIRELWVMCMLVVQAQAIAGLFDQVQELGLGRCDEE